MIHDVMKFEFDANNKYGVALFKRDIHTGMSFPLHWHDYIEFEIILSGTVKHIYNDREYIIHRGSAYMMCNYDFHELVALTDVVLYSIHFDRKIVDPEIIHFLDYNKFHCCFDDTEILKIVQKVEDLEKEINQNISFQAIIIKNIINDIVISMLRKSSPKDLQLAPLPVQQAIAYLYDHFSKPLTLETLAKQLSFSPNYLGSIFKKQMGCTFNEYLNLIRLKHACGLLRSSNLSIKEIANATGYSSIEYFMYVFKQKMMTTPGEYRKSHSQFFMF